MGAAASEREATDAEIAQMKAVLADWAHAAELDPDLSGPYRQAYQTALAAARGDGTAAETASAPGASLAGWELPVAGALGLGQRARSKTAVGFWLAFLIAAAVIAAIAWRIGGGRRGR